MRLLIFLLFIFGSSGYKVHHDFDDLSGYNRPSRKIDNLPEGLVPTVFTPLHPDGSVDLDAISPYAEYLVDKGIKAVLVGGTTGEHMCLNVVTRKKVIAEWIKIARKTGLHIMVQVGAAPFEDVRTLTRYSVEVGADSIMTLPELYFKPRSVDDLVFFVGLVAKEAPHLPIAYYHAPNFTEVRVNMPAFAAEATKRIPNFKGIKFSDSNLAEADQTLRTLKHDQEFYLAPELLFAPGAIIGVRSLITPVLNIFPKLSGAILEAVAKSELDKASYLQHKMALAYDAVSGEGGIPAWKATMEIVTGLKMGPPALPERPLTHAARQRIEMRLKEIGLI